MENKKTWVVLTVAGMISSLLFSSCVTSYDSYGRPIQTVDPAAVAIGAVALGAVAYAAGKNNRHHHHRAYYGGHYRYDDRSYYRYRGRNDCR